MPTEAKEKGLENLKQLVNRYSTIGLIDMNKMPTKELQMIKKNLSNDVIIKVVKKSLIKLAFENSEKNELISILPKQPGILFSNLEPFTLFKKVNLLRFKTFAKERDIASEDVTIQPGPTDLLPGPAISELQKVGLVAGVEGGKIVIKRSATILKKGQEISSEVASVLRKLKIPIAEVKLKIELLFDGNLYPKDALEMVEVYPSKLGELFNKALNLSIAISYPTKENIKYLLIKAYQNMKALENKVG